MGLSRLENFLKNVRGNILYVSPNDLDATDSIENKGNSLTRPFKTIQRALIEAARFSYQSGLNNDRFAQTTILLFLAIMSLTTGLVIFPMVQVILELDLDQQLLTFKHGI